MKILKIVSHCLINVSPVFILFRCVCVAKQSVWNSDSGEVIELRKSVSIQLDSNGKR